MMTYLDGQGAMQRVWAPPTHGAAPVQAQIHQTSHQRGTKERTLQVILPT